MAEKILKQKSKSDTALLKELKQILFNSREQNIEAKLQKLDAACLDESGEDWIELSPAKWGDEDFDVNFSLLVELSAEILRWNQRINDHDIEFNSWLDQQLTCALNEKFKLNKKALSLLAQNEELSGFFSSPISNVQWQIHRREEDNYPGDELHREVVYRFKDINTQNESFIRDFNELLSGARDEIEREEIKRWHKIFSEFARKYDDAKGKAARKKIILAAIEFGISYHDMKDEYLSFEDIKEIFADNLSQLEALRVSSLSVVNRKNELENIFPGASVFLDLDRNFSTISSYLGKKETDLNSSKYDELWEYLSSLDQIALIKFQVSSDERSDDSLYFWDGSRNRDIFAALEGDTQAKKRTSRNPLAKEGRWILNGAVENLFGSSSDSVSLSVLDLWVKKKHLDSDPIARNQQLLKRIEKTGKVPSGKFVSETRKYIRENGLDEFVKITSLNEPSTKKEIVELHDLLVAFKIKVIKVIQE